MRSRTKRASRLSRAGGPPARRPTMRIMKSSKGLEEARRIREESELALAVGDFRRAVDDLVVQADDREVRDGERLVDAARHGCREGTALMWFRSRGAAKWGPEWARVALTLARETSDVLLEGAALEALGGSGSAWAEWLLGRGRYEEALEASEDPGTALLNSLSAVRRAAGADAVAECCGEGWTITAETIDVFVS